MSNPFRLGIIGTGRIAQTYLANLNEVSGLDLVAVCDTEPAVVAASAEAYGCKSYTDPKALLTSEGLDGVVIATPPVTHKEIAIEAFRNGAHVLCEKPVAISGADIREMQMQAREHGRRLMMASKFRYVDDVSKARSIVQAGILGAPVRFENTFANWLDVRERWNSKREIAGGGVLIDNGTHSVDIARFILGPITDVSAYHGPKIQAIEVEDTSHLSFRSASGATGMVDVSWSIHKELSSYVEIWGTEGMLSLGWRESKYRQNHQTTWVQFGNGYDKNLAFRSQLDNFVNHCAGKEPARISSDDALASVLVIEAAYQSADDGSWRKVPQE